MIMENSTCTPTLRDWDIVSLDKRPSLNFKFSTVNNSYFSGSTLSKISATSQPPAQDELTNLQKGKSSSDVTDFNILKSRKTYSPANSRPPAQDTSTNLQKEISASDVTDFNILKSKKTYSPTISTAENKPTNLLKGKCSPGVTDFNIVKSKKTYSPATSRPPAQNKPRQCSPDVTDFNIVKSQKSYSSATSRSPAQNKPTDLLKGKCSPGVTGFNIVKSKKTYSPATSRPPAQNKPRQCSPDVTDFNIVKSQKSYSSGTSRSPAQSKPTDVLKGKCASDVTDFNILNSRKTYSRCTSFSVDRSDLHPKYVSGDSSGEDQESDGNDYNLLKGISKTNGFESIQTELNTDLRNGHSDSSKPTLFGDDPVEYSLFECSNSPRELSPSNYPEKVNGGYQRTRKNLKNQIAGKRRLDFSLKPASKHEPNVSEFDNHMTSNKVLPKRQLQAFLAPEPEPNISDKQILSPCSPKTVCKGKVNGIRKKKIEQNSSSHDAISPVKGNPSSNFNPLAGLSIIDNVPNYTLQSKKPSMLDIFRRFSMAPDTSSVESELPKNIISRTIDKSESPEQRRKNSFHQNKSPSLSPLVNGNSSAKSFSPESVLCTSKNEVGKKAKDINEMSSSGLKNGLSKTGRSSRKKQSYNSNSADCELESKTTAVSSTKKLYQQRKVKSQEQLNYDFFGKETNKCFNLNLDTTVSSPVKVALKKKPAPKKTRVIRSSRKKPLLTKEISTAKCPQVSESDKRETNSLQHSSVKRKHELLSESTKIHSDDGNKSSNLSRSSTHSAKKIKSKITHQNSEISMDAFQYSPPTLQHTLTNSSCISETNQNFPSPQIIKAQHQCPNPKLVSISVCGCGLGNINFPIHSLLAEVNNRAGDAINFIKSLTERSLKIGTFNISSATCDTLEESNFNRTAASTELNTVTIRDLPDPQTNVDDDLLPSHGIEDSKSIGFIQGALNKINIMQRECGLHLKTDSTCHTSIPLTEISVKDFFNNSSIMEDVSEFLGGYDSSFTSPSMTSKTEFEFPEGFQDHPLSEIIMNYLTFYIPKMWPSEIKSISNQLVLEFAFENMSFKESSFVSLFFREKRHLTHRDLMSRLSYVALLVILGECRKIISL